MNTGRQRASVSLSVMEGRENRRSNALKRPGGGWGTPDLSIRSDIHGVVRTHDSRLLKKILYTWKKTHRVVTCAKTSRIVKRIF